jgi:hypothetical protein
MRFGVILTGALVAAALAACGPDSASPAPGTGTGTNNAGAAATGRDGCLMGTWKVDVPDMARQAAGLMRTSGSEGSGTGNITLVFGDQMSITYDNAVIAITTPMGSGLSMKVTSTYTGTASSTDWQAKDGQARRHHADQHRHSTRWSPASAARRWRCRPIPFSGSST